MPKKIEKLELDSNIASNPNYGCLATGIQKAYDKINEMVDGYNSFFESVDGKPVGEATPVM